MNIKCCNKSDDRLIWKSVDVKTLDAITSENYNQMGYDDADCNFVRGRGMTT